MRWLRVQTMGGLVLDKLQVVVTGAEAAIARDVIRLLVSDGACVIAADRDRGKLARLARDVGLYHAQIDTAEIDLGSRREMTLWERSLAGLGRLPHLVICCCGAQPHARSRRAAPASPADVSVSESPGPDCPAAIAACVLQPSLFLHAQPLRRSAFNRALTALRHPTLRGVLERGPGRGVFNPEAVTPYVRLASHLYSMRRAADVDWPRLRLAAPPPTPPRADAA